MNPPNYAKDDAKDNAKDDASVPEELRRLASRPRVLVRRGGAPRQGGRCVVYWMQRAMRIIDNPALDVAIEAANLLELPVAVFFSVIPNYPNANLRHYHFLAQGLRDVEADAAGRGVGFVVGGHPDNSLEAFLEDVGAAMLVGDENPCREPERWRRVLARRLKIPFWTVDADVVVPSRVFGRSFALLHHFRPHLKAELPKYLLASPKIEPAHPWKPKKAPPSFALDRDITEGFAKLDRTVKPVDAFTGGTHAALKRLREFVRDDLKHYEERRNHPETKGTSRLSPHLHFGHIGPITIALAVQAAVKQGRAPASAEEKFLDELIGWRELAALFVRHEPNYDNWESAAPWAQKTLVEHAADSRDRRYTFEQLERGETGDDLWNAAQRQMTATGWMHNVMRMYWAKKILEWAPDPARAFEWAVTLNDRYELDGRDPNGYAGIAWAIVGRHDRPWFNRPVYGLVRPTTDKSLRRKFDAEAYIRQNSPGQDETLF
jgi:deoxyribodipyrimidine photo-lyase